MMTSKKLHLNTVQHRNESEGKELFRQAFAYAEKLQLLMKRVTDPKDVFETDMSLIRSKIHEKCERILFLSCSKRRKAEELLWRNVFYSVISLCKKYREILDPDHHCYILYTKHLMSCSVYYQQLMQTLQSHYDVEVTKMDSKELEDIDTASQKGIDSVWIKEACQRCYIYLGDTARYQIELGYSLNHAVAFYQQAVSLDPNNGWPFNQLAALSESQHCYLEALYYYLRSSSALKPFPGVDKNVTRLFEKNLLVLQGLEENQEKVQEPEIRSFNRRLFIFKFISLQQLFYNLSKNKDSSVSSTAEITSLCSKVVSLFELCLESDYEEYDKECLQLSKPDKLTNNREQELPDLPLLKMSALSLLPAYYLRLKGSADTVTACAFALTILSLIIHYAHKRMASIVVSLTTNNTNQPIEDIMKSEQTMIQLLLSETIQQTTPTAISDICSGNKKSATAKDMPPTKSTRKSTSLIKSKKRSTELRAEKRRKALEFMNRRRRHRRKGGDSCSDDESDSSHSDSDSSLSSIEQLGEDIDLSLIESLSDSSNSELDEPVIKPVMKSLNQSSISADNVSVPTKGRKNIILAANFSMSSGTSTNENPTTTGASLIPNSSPVPILDTKASDTKPGYDSSKRKSPMTTINHEAVLLEQDLNALSVSTTRQEIIHKACQIASEEKYLCCVKVFADWLQSFPAVLASCGKMSSTILWSRLADLINFIPNEVDLRDEGIGIGIDKTHSCSSWTQSCAISEDIDLRGFSPLLRIHHDLLFQMDQPTQIKQGIMRVQCLIKFAHFIVNSKTTHFFSYNESSERFMAFVQIEREKERDKMAAMKHKEEKAQLNRSKLMKTMAEQRLKSEVDALTVATAKKKAALFTPYLLPDAITLCHNLHLVKKLMKSKKFVIIIAKSVIECLDQMKKGKSNYAARDTIKFLEKELQEGNRFIRAQKDSETLSTDKKKPVKQDIDTWLFSCLVDCGVYFNCYSGGVSDTPHIGSSLATPTTGPLLTMLLDKSLVKSLDVSDATPTKIDPDLVKLLNEAKQGGVEVSTIVQFHQRWQRSQRYMK